MLGTFLLLYAVLTLYGASLVYKDIRDTGCDPSDGVADNVTCDSSGPDVFGAMLGTCLSICLYAREVLTWLERKRNWCTCFFF